MVPLTGQNTINDMVDKINEVAQEIENVSTGNANAVQGPATSVANQLMTFADNTGKLAKAATNVSTFAYSILDDVDDAAMRVTLGLKSAAVLDAATAATTSTVVQRDASGNITGVGITATSGFVGNGSQITSLNMGNAASGTLAVAYGGTGTTSATGAGSTVRNTSPTFAGTPLSTTASADTNTTQIATTAFVIGQASSVSPAMNGTATIGTSLRYARADHVHPSDTSKVNTSLLGVANGVATLDSGGKVPSSQLPAYVDDVLEYTNLASFPATGETGKIYVALNTNKTYRWSGSTYIYITSGAVDSVAGKTGVVTLVKGDVGLGNVDNTSDANKPISAATQTALDAKLDAAANAASATKLQTARTINGVSFDGTANITVADSTKQPLKATLTALGNLTTDSNKLPYFAGVSVATTTDITSFGRSLIDDPDAPSARTTLGLGSAAVANITTSTTDTTAGSILKVGDFGVGGVGIPITDANNATLNGAVYQLNSPYTNSPNAGSIPCVISVTAENGRITQRAAAYFSSFGAVAYYVRSYNGAAWSKWYKDAVSDIDIASEFSAVTTARVEQNVSGTYDVFVGGATSYALTMTANTTIGFNQFYQINASTLAIDMYVFGAFTPTFSGVTWEGGSVPPYIAGQRYQFVVQKNEAGTASVLGRVNTPSFGDGQTWLNVTGSRALNTTYTNSTPRPIQVMVGGSGTPTNTVVPTVAGLALPTHQASATGSTQKMVCSFIVPAGATYSVAMSTGSLLTWSELR